MTITLDDYSPRDVLDALRRGRVALQTRMLQLAACRACATEREEAQRAIMILKDLERQLTGAPV